MRRAGTFFLFAVMVALAVGACGTSTSGAPQSVPATTAGAAAAPAVGYPTARATVKPVSAVTAEATAMPAAVLLPSTQGGQRTTVTLTSFTFNPSTLTARVGQPVRLKLDNSDNLIHEFVIDGTDVRALLERRTAQDLDFVFNRPGTYTYACTITAEGDHRMLGMVGKIEVRP